MDHVYTIHNEQELEAIIGEPMEFVKVKVVSKLDAIMKEFIQQSPLIFISTIDSNGHVDTSPKGDPNGFVEVDSNGQLLIPERPGNKLTFGFRNILRNGEIGLIFIVPNQRETLRVKGIASLHNDPDILQRMVVNGKPALMYTRVDIKECFFHCGKAMIRSKLWQPESWDKGTVSIGARQFASLGGKTTKEGIQKTEKHLEQSYTDELY